MNWGKLKRSLQREFKRNKAKTCVLLALLPVAGYFVGPVVWKMLPHSKSRGPAAEAATATSPTATASFVNVVPTVSVAVPATAAWHDAADWIASDARMTAAPASGLRNPFQIAVNELQRSAGQESDHDARKEVSEELRRPEDFGLQLTATIVGSRLRLATINGKQYRENATVMISNMEEAPSDPITTLVPGFVLKTVAKKHVVLEREGKLYQLQLAR